jgi:hypothetical protein
MLNVNKIVLAGFFGLTVGREKGLSPPEKKRKSYGCKSSTFPVFIL